MTKKARQAEWTALCLAVVLFAGGCAHEVGRMPRRDETPPPPALTRPAPTPQMRLEGVYQGIERLQTLVEGNRLTAEDRLLAQELLDTYRTLERSPAAGGAAEETGALIELLVSSLVKLENRYFQKPPAEEAAPFQGVALFSDKRRIILDSYLASDYQGVVDGCLELERVFGPDSLTPEIGLVFALSLGKRGMIQEALRMGTRISDELEGKPDLIQLRARMLEWQIALGDRKGAVRSYEKLVDNMHEREADLKNAEQALAGRGPQKPPFDKTRESAAVIDVSKEPASVQEVLRQVDALVRKNDFETARLLLLRLRIRLQDGPDAELVEQTMRSVELAEENSRQGRSAEDSRKEETLRLAANLIDQEKYEEAIAELEVLQQGKEAAPEARQLQERAVEKIVNRERDKAARLFLMARNATDVSKKRELLISSHNILKALIEKYPTSPLNQKISENIKRIEEELSKLNTTALPFPELADDRR